MRVVIVDIDGTVAFMGKGKPGRRGPFEWDRVDEDDPNQPIIDLVNTLRSAGNSIFFVSGRDESCREKTFAWLIKYGVAMGGEPLLMRPSGDFRPDEQIKRELYEREIVNNDRWPAGCRAEVSYVIDDRDKVVRMWRSLGLTVLQVADGNF